MREFNESTAGRLLPIEEPDLPGAVVMASCVTQLQIAVEEFKSTLSATSRLIDEQFEVLKAFGDLYLELTDESAKRRWLDDRIKRAEREAARLRLPIWFWRPEKDAKLHHRLAHRARWMIEQKYHEDDVWDMLREYVDHIGARQPSDKILNGIISFVEKSLRTQDKGDAQAD